MNFDQWINKKNKTIKETENIPNTNWGGRYNIVYINRFIGIFTD